MSVVVASAVVVMVVVRVSKLDPNLATFACCEGFKYQHMQQPLNHCHYLLCNILHQEQTFGHFTPEFNLHWTLCKAILYIWPIYPIAELRQRRRKHCPYFVGLHRSWGYLVYVPDTGRYRVGKFMCFGWNKGIWVARGLLAAWNGQLAACQIYTQLNTGSTKNCEVLRL